MNEAYPVVAETATIPPVPSPRLLVQVRGILRAKHYSYRTEQAYVHWIRRFILFHGKRHPREMGTAEIERFLTDLAVKGNVSASTQTQALCSLPFLYQHVLKIKLGTLDAVRAERPKRLPVVLSRDEVRRLLASIQGAHGAFHLMAGLMYGSGLRLMECCRLRVKDVDFDRRQLIVREAKGDKDRAVPLPQSLSGVLERQVGWREELHRIDRCAVLAVSICRRRWTKLPAAAYELGWQFVFASERISCCPRTKRSGRHHLHENAIARAVTSAARRSGLRKHVTCHVFRHSFATHLFNQEATSAPCKIYWGIRMSRRR